jgi:Holliday junction resolvase RusA-like endonuclease
MVTFVVEGDPVAQPRPRISTAGGFGRAYVPSGHGIHAYRLDVQAAARRAFRRPLDGPVEVVLQFELPRPKSHWCKRGLSSSAPAYPGKPDWDNLSKAVCDALNAVAYHDDSQIVRTTVTKTYIPGRAVQGRTTVSVWEVATERDYAEAQR